MSLASHTPGPWTIYGLKDLPQIDDLMIIAAQVGPDNTGEELYICNIGPDIAPLGTTDATPQNIANASLIAAAPDLLAACRSFVDWLEREDKGFPRRLERGTPAGEAEWRIWFDTNMRLCGQAVDTARAAVAKAEGRPA